MGSRAQQSQRPLAVTVIASFQWFVACYLLYFAANACLDPSANLGDLRSALRLFIGRTDHQSYAKVSHADLLAPLVVLTITALAIVSYSAITGWGLWRLKKWARHSVAGICGMEAIFWLRSFLYFGMAGGFSRVPQSKLQPVFIVFYTEVMIFMTLTFYGGVAEAFGELGGELEE